MNDIDPFKTNFLMINYLISAPMIKYLILSNKKHNSESFSQISVQLKHTYCLLQFMPIDRPTFVRHFFLHQKLVSRSLSPPGV